MGGVSEGGGRDMGEGRVETRSERIWKERGEGGGEIHRDG